jgi:hypothetical protein
MATPDYTVSAGAVNQPDYRGCSLSHLRARTFFLSRVHSAQLVILRARVSTSLAGKLPLVPEDDMVAG